MNSILLSTKYSFGDTRGCHLVWGLTGRLIRITIRARIHQGEWRCKNESGMPAHIVRHSIFDFVHDIYAWTSSTHAIFPFKDMFCDTEVASLRYVFSQMQMFYKCDISDPDFMIRVSPIQLPVPRTAKPVQVLLPDGLNHPRFKARKAGFGHYIYCNRATFGLLQERGKLGIHMNLQWWEAHYGSQRQL